MLERYPASEFIKMAMEEKGLSSYDLAKKSGINSKTISLLLNNKTPFTLKMDYLISPVLGFDVGVLSGIEAKYNEWFNLQEKNWKQIDVDKFNFSYRKHKKINVERFKKILINSERKIRLKHLLNNNIDFSVYLTDFFFNEYLYLIDRIDNINLFNDFIIDLSNKNNIHIYFFENVNIRGMSKEYNSNLFIFINKSLNKTIDSFIITLTHEFLHHINFKIPQDLESQAVDQDDIKNIDDEKQEKMLDKIAMNYMLKGKMNMIYENNLVNLDITHIKEFSKYLDINWIYYYGFSRFEQNIYLKNETIKEITINYGDKIWENKNI